MIEIVPFNEDHRNAVTAMLQTLHDDISAILQRPSEPRMLASPTDPVAPDRTDASGRRTSSYMIRVALNGTRPIGFIGFHVFATSDPSEPTRAMVTELYVVPSHRRKGTGTELMQHAQHTCRGLGAGAIHVNVHVANSNAAALYNKMGYQTIKMSLRREL